MGEKKKKKTRFRLWLIDWLFPALYGFFLVWRQEQCGAWRADRTNHYTASDRRFVITFYFWLFYGCRLVTKRGNIAGKWTNTSSSELVLSFFLTEDHTLHHFNNLELFWLPFEHMIDFWFLSLSSAVDCMWLDCDLMLPLACSRLLTSKAYCSSRNDTWNPTEARSVDTKVWGGGVIACYSWPSSNTNDYLH